MSAKAHSEDNLLECVQSSEKSIFNRESSRAQLLASEDSVLYSECSDEPVLEREANTSANTSVVLKNASAVLNVQDNGSAILDSNDITLELDVTAERNRNVLQSVLTSEGQHSRVSIAMQLDSSTGSNVEEVDVLTTRNEPAEKSPDIEGYSSRATQRKASQQYTKMRKYSSVCKVLEIGVLTIIILVLLGVYMIPTAYFINPPLRLTSVSRIDT